MNLPVLYSYRRCPYAMRARMALKYAGIQVEIREISLRDKPPSMLALSPKGTVPILKLQSGEVIDQSLDIMKWALRQHDPAQWLTELNHAETTHLIEINDGVFKKLLDQYKYPQRHDVSEQDVLQKAIEVQIKPLNDRLEKHHYLLGEDCSLVDVAIFPFIRQFSMVDPPMFATLPYLSLKRWLGQMLEGVLFNSVMDKYPVWKD